MTGVIVLTRPEDRNLEDKKALEAMGFSVLSAPMLSIHPVDFEAPGLAGYQAVIFTSTNGVRFYSDKITDRSLPVFTVGARTAKEASDYGFKDVRSADGDAQDLQKLIYENVHDKEKKLLYVHGQDIAFPLEEKLSHSGFQTDSLVVYEAVAAASLPEDLRRAIQEKEAEAVLFFSKRTAEAFMKLAGDAGLKDDLLHTKVLCISTPVLECVQSSLWKESLVAARPDRDSMLDLLKRGANFV